MTGFQLDLDSVTQMSLKTHKMDSLVWQKLKATRAQMKWKHCLQFSRIFHRIFCHVVVGRSRVTFSFSVVTQSTEFLLFLKNPVAMIRLFLGNFKTRVKFWVISQMYRVQRLKFDNLMIWSVFTVSGSEKRYKLLLLFFNNVTFKPPISFWGTQKIK